MGAMQQLWDRLWAELTPTSNLLLLVTPYTTNLCVYQEDNSYVTKYFCMKCRVCMCLFAETPSLATANHIII